MRGYERLNLSGPCELLDQAEKAGQLVALEQMLHARAVTKFTGTSDFESKRLFLNLDSRAMTAAAMLFETAEALMRSQSGSPGSICIELSERFNSDAMEEFSVVLAQLRRSGARLAIDDLGVGFSKLKLMCDHGVDYVKIDGHFIRGINESSRKRLFVTTITNLAHVLGTRVIAEGVETEADYLGCREAGCDLVQGYFVARPTTELSELLPVYPHVVTARAKYRRDRNTDELLVRSEMVALPALRQDTNIEAAFDLFRKAPRESFFPVVDAADAPCGIIHERDLKSYIYRDFGRELLRNRTYQRGLASFVTPCPIVDIDTDANRILEMFASASSSDGVIVTENMRYLGVLSAPALLKVISEKKVQYAQDQNPLTELPGNLSIADHVAVAALDGESERCFCYFDFNNFKPFNDRYGFKHGDSAITLFAGLLRRRVSGRGTFVGHVGGDDFFVGYTGCARAEIEKMVATLLEDFRQEVAKLYSTEDRINGFILGYDRDGHSRRYPLLGCSAAVLILPAGVVTVDLDRIDTAIAGVKSKAKRAKDGIAWETYTA
jgi:EAL domain-containing protein (putative c-di-GMP-specific phosphodiesterase class I)/GGDEF domain-containing protein